MNGDKKKPPLPPKVEKILAKLDELIARHKAVLIAEDYEAARKIGREITAFVILHQQDLKIPPGVLVKLAILDDELDEGFDRVAKSEGELKEITRRVEEEYYQWMLENPPGKGETGH